MKDLFFNFKAQRFILGHIVDTCSTYMRVQHSPSLEQSSWQSLCDHIRYYRSSIQQTATVNVGLLWTKNNNWMNITLFKIWKI